MSDLVRYEERGRVAVITLNRPDSLNAFTSALGQGILAAFAQARDSDGVRSVVFTGAGRGFSAGAELKGEFPEPAATIAKLEEDYGPGILAIASLPKPVIAAVNGFATGIGASFALACDLVFIGETAFLQVPFARIGLVPDGGMSWQLASRLGPRLAFELALSGERIAASRCVELGLANRTVPDAELVQVACAAAETLSHCAPLAVAGTKRLLRRAVDLGFEATLHAEAREQGQCVGSRDFREGVQAFIGKRQPRFTGG